MNKVILTKAQAEAIEAARRFGCIEEVVSVCANNKMWVGFSEYKPLNGIDLPTLMSALVNGYEVELTPEEKVREYCTTVGQAFRDRHSDEGASYNSGRLTGIRTTLTLLGIKIEGVNA